MASIKVNVKRNGKAATVVFRCIWNVIVVASLLSMTGCTPVGSVSRAQPTAYVGSTTTVATPPVTAAIVVGESLSRPYSPPLIDAIYTSALLQLRRHPFFRPRFILVERNQLDSILEEQGLGARGVVNLSTAPQIGNVLGAQKFIYVELLEADANRTGASLGGTPVGTVSAIGYRTTVSVSMRLVDTETGQLEALGFASDEAFVPESVVLNRLRAGVSEVDSAIIELLENAVFKAANDLAIDYDLN
jgi:curli biogenesis system outer membrane secretion channel CsgG